MEENETEEMFDLSLLSDEDQEISEHLEAEQNLLVTHRDLVNEIRNSGIPFMDKKQQIVLFEFLASKLGLEEDKLQTVQKYLNEKIRLFLTRVQKKYIRSGRNYDRLLNDERNQVSISPTFLSSFCTNILALKTTNVKCNCTYILRL